MDRVIAMEVTGYQIRHGADTLGAAGTGNAVLLHLTFDTAWDGMVKTAKFTDARGDGGVTTELELLTRNGDGSYTLPVPREAMAYEGTAELTLIGEIAEGGVVVKRLTTKPLALRVYGSGADREAQNVQAITATDKQQILAKVDAAEAYARGTVDGLPVPERAEDNAKYYKEQASASAEAAEGAAVTAGNQAAAALGYRNGAQTFASRASGFAATAEAEKIAAETAQGKAEDAQTAAAASASDALASSQTAQAWAEGKRGDADVPSTDPAYHNNAKYWSEQAAQTLSSAQELLNDLNTHRYDAFASETQSGESILHTDIGADGVPVKSLTATVTSGTLPVTLTLKKMGKNLFSATNTLIYGKMIDDSSGEIVSSPSSCVAAEYIQVLPDTTYSFSLAWPGNYGYRLYVRFYSLDKRYLSGARSPTDSTLTFKTPAECYWVRFIVPQWCHSKYVNNPKEGDIGTFRSQYKPQLELGAESAYKAYTEQDYSITVTERNTPTELSASVITRLGENVFQLQRIDGVTAKMSVTYRCDPTLAYEKLKAAIVAAGTT